jgi:hypothetical protein
MKELLEHQESNILKDFVSLADVSANRLGGAIDDSE